MRIGSYEIRRRTLQATPEPAVGGRARNKLTRELGGTGTSIYGGYLDEEWNSLLKSGKWYTIADKMRLSDAQVQAVWLAITLPIRAAEWGVQPASDDPADIKIAETVEENLFSGMVHSFDDFLRQALLHLFYGSIGFEPIYEVRDGLFLWRKFAARMPDTFSQYIVDPDTEELQTIKQQVTKAGRWEYVDIPADRLMLFVNNLEGANYKGWSILRAAWKHWKIKDMLYKLNAIAMERWATGIPRVSQTDSGIGTFDEAQAIDIAKDMRSHEGAYVIQPLGYDIDIMFPGGTMPDPLPMITHHNKMITQAALASFINLGQDKVGSYSLSRDQKDVFFLAIQSVVKYLQMELNNRIRELVRFNWPVKDADMPTMRVENLQAKDLKTISGALMMLAKAGVLTAGPDIEEWARKLYGMPDMPDTVRDQPRQTPALERVELQAGSDKYVPWRALRPEEKYLDIQGMYRKLTGVQDRFTGIAKDLRRQQIKIMLERGLRALMKKSDKEFYDAVDAIKVPFYTRMKNELSVVLKDVYKYGKTEVRAEISRQSTRRLQGGETFDPVEGDAASNRYLSKVSEQSTDEINKGLLATLVFGLYGLHRQGSTDLGQLRTRLESRSDREIKRAAGLAVSTAFNMGRRTTVNAMRKAGAPIERAVYSAVMDGNTCDNCAGVDGTEVEVGSAEYEDIYPPLQSSQGGCLGGGNCRCIMVFLTQERAA